jgi:hypothetical protein
MAPLAPRLGVRPSAAVPNHNVIPAAGIQLTPRGCGARQAPSTAHR